MNLLNQTLPCRQRAWLPAEGRRDARPARRRCLQHQILATALLAIGALAQSALAQPTLTDADRTEIQSLMGKYSQTLSACKGADFADLFTPDGAFASGFRGRMVGCDRLIALVESERNCAAPAQAKGPATQGKGQGKAQTARTGGASGPTTVLEVTPSGVRGIATLGTAEYQDEYVKTSQGWRFASRTVIMGTEKAAGLDAKGVLAIQKLGGAKIADHYEPDANGVQRLMTSGVKVDVAGDKVTGRAYLKDGSYDDELYEKTPSGDWKIKSTTHIPAPTK